MADTWKISPEWTKETLQSINGGIPQFANLNNVSTIDTDGSGGEKFFTLLKKHATAGSVFSTPVAKTYSIVTSVTYGYFGGLLAPDGSVHFINFFARRNHRIDRLGTISTYSIPYTALGSPPDSGYLDPKGYIHTIQIGTSPGTGSKLFFDGKYPTSFLTYPVTVFGTRAWAAGVIAPDGYIHLPPYDIPNVGLRIDTRDSGISNLSRASTYPVLAADGVDSYRGAVLDQYGYIHYIPHGSSTAVGQKINHRNLQAITYPINNPGPGNTNFFGGVLDPNGNIHYVPFASPYGQKINPQNNQATTYSLVYTTNQAYCGGVLAPNGDIHFVPFSAQVGQKVSKDGVVSTYRLAYTTAAAYAGGVCDTNGDIHFVPHNSTTGQKVFTWSALPFEAGTLVSPYLNKF